MTAVTIVMPLLLIFLANGFFAREWSLRMWWLTIAGILLVLIANLVFVFV
jgi:hypothetical protein